METPPTYPTSDAARGAVDEPKGARIAGVVPESPADDAGFEPGCFLTSVDGQPLRDVIDWRWLSGDECITVGYVDLDGDAGEVELWRDPGEDWGFEFEGLVFDGVKQCRNACTFCFMRMLPRNMRPSLYVRDDDFRLSFLVGTFVTLTNLTPEDEERIVEQRISPLRFSLQVSNADVRRRMLGKHAQHGIDALERLLAAGIEFHAQIVLVPEQNDGEVLVETLNWAYERPGILSIGIVPLGYTRFQDTFDHSFNDSRASRALLDGIAPFQERSLAERGHAWVFAADEFYRNAYCGDLLENLPPTSYYGDFSMFEDGIGIIRSTVDDWRRAEAEGLIAHTADALRDGGKRAVMVAGCAQREFLDPLVAESGIGDIFEPLYVSNAYFGGNVDVTGLLVGADIAREVARYAAGLAAKGKPVGRDGLGGCDNTPASTVQSGSVPDMLAPLFLVPRVVFNDDGLTLDDMTLGDIEKAAGQSLHVVSCSPIHYFDEIAKCEKGV